MPTSDPATILLAHDHWATRNVIDACRDMSHVQFHTRFEMGMGTLHDTLLHMLSAMRGWGDLLAGREMREGLDPSEQRSCEDLLLLLDGLGAELTESANAHPLDETVTGEYRGTSYTFTRGAVITHITTHGMHHRAQCVNMLRQMGIDPLPAVSVLEWMMEVDGQGAT